MSDVRVLSGAVVGIHLARLRDAATVPADFRTHARVLGGLLAQEAVRDVPTTTVEVATPLAPATAAVPACPVVAEPVLRAGLGLLPGVQDVLPDVAVGMIGLERDPSTLRPREYYAKVPPAQGALVLVLEPMLATGGSAATAARSLASSGALRVTVCSVVATQEAIDRIGREAPGTNVVTAAIDPTLNEVGYIVPGLGDFGDRLFGTPH